jgi:HSP20 family molecular chaperone IbpA
MSLTRQFFRDLRPLFQILHEPFGRSPSHYAVSRPLFDDIFFHSPNSLRPAIDVTEEGNSYFLEAELPGVKKENVEVRISEGGRSVTIEGKFSTRRGSTEEKVAEAAPTEDYGEGKQNMH